MKPSFWKTDWFLGLFFALAFLFAARAGLQTEAARGK